MHVDTNGNINRKILFKKIVLIFFFFFFLCNRADSARKRSRKRTCLKEIGEAKEKLVARYIKRTRRISWRTRFVPEYRAIFNRASFTPTDQPIFYVNTATRKIFLSLFFFLSFKIKFSIASFPPAENSRNGTDDRFFSRSVLFTISRRRFETLFYRSVSRCYES